MSSKILKNKILEKAVKDIEKKTSKNDQLFLNFCILLPLTNNFLNLLFFFLK